ncbi:hypothetical protein [Neisseria sp. S1]|uniref:hypothetical protein n=1 Tax=Neisseria sp. S1 TaxID=3318354 RepID=UPI003A846EFB
MQEKQSFEYGGRIYKTKAHASAMVQINRLLAAKAVKPADLPVQPVREQAAESVEVGRLLNNAQAHGLSELAGLLLDSQQTVRTANVLIANLDLGIKPLLLPEVGMLLAEIDRISAEAYAAAARLNVPAVREDLRRRGLVKAINDRRADEVKKLVMQQSGDKRGRAA